MTDFSKTIFELQLDRAKYADGFLAALDQSGGSTPKALKLYGISENEYVVNEKSMYDAIHDMRTRMMTSPHFHGERILGAILFEDTMDREVDGKPTCEYLWEVKHILPFLKVDKGLCEAANGVQLMKPMPELTPLLRRAKAKGVFGTKMRSVILNANEKGIADIVAQQFEVGKQIIAEGLIPILEPEVDIKCPQKIEAEQTLKDLIMKHLDTLGPEEKIMIKLTIPTIDNMYTDLIRHPNVIRVVALSGGYSRAKANELLARNKGMIASFSRALTEGLSKQQTDAEFNKILDDSIQCIFDASVAPRDDTFEQQLERAKNADGFLAALDQSGGSTPKALKLYGISENEYTVNEKSMFDAIHDMRTRMMKSPHFHGDRVLGAILFEDTMDRDVDGIPTCEYLWEVKHVLPILKVDKGLSDKENGVQLMKPMPNLVPLLRRAKAKGVFGTKMRSVILDANHKGIADIVAQQFEVGKQIIAEGLIPILEPEVDINIPNKAEAEKILKGLILKRLDTLGPDEKIMIKLTIPTEDNLYADLIKHPNVIRVVALSGGYSRAKANELLARNKGMIASFSRALTEGLSKQQTDAEFNKILDDSIQCIFDASVAPRDDTFEKQLERAKNADGFLAALDQSGGSTPKALKLYGIFENEYIVNEKSMFDAIHDMRTRMMTSPHFHGDRVLGAILFEDTMDREVEGIPTCEYLWEVKHVLPILKVDKGLCDAENGVQLMKPMPNLEPLLRRAKSKGVFGTKMRSVILDANEKGIADIVAQQFEVGKQIIAEGLIPILEPEVDINIPNKVEAEKILKDLILKNLDSLGPDEKIMIKLTIPTEDNLYADLIKHSNVIRVVALSGGYSRAKANELLARNMGMIASFSRALTEGLSKQQTDEEFNKTLNESIQCIFDASILPRDKDKNV